MLHALGVTGPAPAIAIAMASPVNVGGSPVGVLYGGTVETQRRTSSTMLAVSPAARPALR